MHLSLRTSVNRWECDENDHMNVRFFLAKHWETLNSQLGQTDLLGAIRVHHLRFHQEARLAAPLSGYLGVVEAETGEQRYMTELRQSFTQDVMSTCLHDFGHASLDGAIPLPPYAGPRGVQDATSEFSRVAYEELAQRGFALIGLGSIGRNECDASGRLLPAHYMGRLSDSMPHLWGAVHESGVLDEDEGGAVLEYRLEYFAGLRFGERFEIWSGLRGVGEKLQEFVHLVFNGERQLALVAEAVGVRLDLVQRKSKVLPADVVALMQGQVVDRSDLTQE